MTDRLNKNPLATLSTNERWATQTNKSGTQFDRGSNGTVTPPTLLLTAGDTARALAISPRKLWELTNRGEVPFIRIGKLLRYSPDVLKDWITRQHDV